MHSKYGDRSNVAHNTFSIIPHGVGVEDSCGLGQEVISWRLSKTTGETLSENVPVIFKKFAQANNRLLAGDDPVLDLTHTDDVLEIMGGRH